MTSPDAFQLVESVDSADGIIGDDSTVLQESASAIPLIILTDKKTSSGEGGNYLGKESVSSGFFPVLVAGILGKARLKKQLRQSHEAFHEFTHKLAHDLKAPLRHITAFSSYLKEDYKDKLDGEGITYLDKLVASATRMRDMIDTMQDDALSKSKGLTEERPVNDGKQGSSA